MLSRKLGFSVDDKIGISKYFKWHEALFLQRINAYAIPNSQQIKNIQILASRLDKLREHYGREFIITSWLRPQHYNKIVGGALMSSHMDGLAVDFLVKGLKSQDIRNDIIANPNLWQYRMELNENLVHVHLDIKGDIKQNFYAK